jgi:DNA/RNA endonuclease G (NUC1)
MRIGILKGIAKVLTVVMLLTGFTAKGQDIEKVRNINYTSYFSKSQHIPVLVIYSIVPEQFNCNKLKGETGINFAPDPQLPDYTSLKMDYDNSLFDPAQMMAPFENSCDKDAYTESFYYTNVMPMPKNLFKDLWNKLHEKEIVKAKKYKKIKVFAGTVGRNWVVGAEHNVIVPEYCWKVIYIPSIDQYLCYEFHNTEPYNPNDKVNNHKVDLSTIEALAGVHFVNGVVTASYVVPTANPN